MAEQRNNRLQQLPAEAERRGALVIRTLPILLIPVLVGFTTFALLFLTTSPQIEHPDGQRGAPFFPLIPIVILIMFFSALIILVRLGRPKLSAIALIGVWTLLTTLTALQNGVTTILPALLIIPICVAGLLIDGTANVSLAALATLLVGSVAWLEAQGLLPPSDEPQFVKDFLSANQQVLSVAFWTGLFWTIAALTSLLAGGLHRALKQSQAHADALSALSSQLEARVVEQTAQLLDQEREAATLEERTRLARDIHDTLAQGLTGIVVQLGAAQRALATAPSEAGQHLGLAQQMARESLAEARRSVWNLRAPALERGDLADALQSLAAHPLQAETTIRFEQSGDAWPLTPAVESALLRIGQEALANIAKHAHATRADIVLAYTPQAVKLTVKDDGIGFNEQALAQPAPIAGPWSSFGLLGIRERLIALGGTFEFRNDHGAQVIATIPRAVAERHEPKTIELHSSIIEHERQPA